MSKYCYIIIVTNLRRLIVRSVCTWLLPILPLVTASPMDSVIPFLLSRVIWLVPMNLPLGLFYQRVVSQ